MPGNRRCWLGNKLTWQYVNYLGRGRCWTVKVPCNKQRLPWLRSSERLIAAVFHVEHVLELFDTEDSANITGMSSFCRFSADTVSLHALQELIPSRLIVEGLYTGLLGVDLAEKHRNDFSANDFLAHWQSEHVSGWWVIEKCGVGVAIVRDYCCIHDRRIHAVEISSEGLSIYKFDLNRCSALADRDKIVCKRIAEADIDWMLGIFAPEAVVSIRLAIRFYRLAIFRLAFDHEELPF